MLDKKYNHTEVEKDKYSIWLDKKYFEAGDIAKKPYSIVIPPPNVTGKLHLGHAWDTTIQDIIIRFKRMQGYDALWLSGMDHAGIATQAKVDERLRSEGIKPRELGREEWLNHAWSWKEEYAKTIREQWAKLGLSLDYSKERFTMDKGFNEAVQKVFIDYYNKGLIYRGERPINWDPKAGTALSNIEVIYKEEVGTMYYFKYFIEGTEDYIEVATTRPETLGADTALVVHPKDDRYKNIIGKNVITPLRKEAIPVITDNFIDMEFGSGAMKCSAHAIEDIRILKENNIKVQECINKDGLLNENATGFAGMTREDGRKAIALKLKEEGLLIKEEEHIHQVGHSERTDIPVEIMVMPQWFVKMGTLAEATIDLQNSEDKINFTPERFNKALLNWMENIEDWCISRQLWWGHRIPAWYKSDEIYVGKEAPEGEGWKQDPDVLDTWFSSALWPFSTLGWPDNTEDLERYFPNNTLVTGYDILPFWVARMIFQSIELTKRKPFDNCIIHGLIRDNEGRKMSKSLGNGVDPMDIIKEYGADALRFFLTTNSAPGQDLRYDEEKVKSSWNFINKIWNASRFVLMGPEDFKEEDYTLDNLELKDKWILSKLNNTIKSVTESMEKFDFNNVGIELYNFVWGDFCDKYIELSKNNDNVTTKSVLLYTLTNILKMLHPFMPFVTEEIYQMLPIKTESITTSEYPIINESQYFEFEENEVNILIQFIRYIRNNLAENKISKILSYDTSNINFTLYTREWKNLLDHELEKLFRPPTGNVKGDVFEIKSVPGKLIIYYDGSINIKEHAERIEKEINKVEQSIKRRESLLNNTGYVNNAPQIVVEQDRIKLKEERSHYEKLTEQLDDLKDTN